MIRLLLADDHALVREGLKQLFALTPDIVVADEAINGAQVVEAVERERFDLILLDITMPGVSGSELISRLRASVEPPPVLVLSMHNEPQIVRRSLAAGAAGYLTKDNDPAILLAAIRKVAAGGRFLDPSLAEATAFESAQPDQSRPLHAALSERELQVFSLFAKGHTVNDIAERLAISNKTVSTHKARLMEKMGFASNADLVRYAIIHGVTD